MQEVMSFLAPSSGLRCSAYRVCKGIVLLELRNCASYAGDGRIDEVMGDVVALGGFASLILDMSQATISSHALAHIKEGIRARHLDSVTCVVVVGHRNFPEVINPALVSTGVALAQDLQEAIHMCLGRGQQAA